jgi:hypothetical protein
MDRYIALYLQTWLQVAGRRQRSGRQSDSLDSSAAVRCMYPRGQASSVLAAAIGFVNDGVVCGIELGNWSFAWRGR